MEKRNLSFSQNDPFFTFDSPKTTFLLSVHEKDDRFFKGHIRTSLANISPIADMIF